MKLSYLFISHDLSVVRHIADRVGVMYLGRLVEEGPTDEIFSNPRHPYTKLLLSSVPAIHEHEKREKLRLKVKFLLLLIHLQAVRFIKDARSHLTAA